jgi:hypothetical protein
LRELAIVWKEFSVFYFFLEERGHIKGHLSQIIVIFLTLGETLPQQRDRYWDISLVKSLNS